MVTVQMSVMEEVFAVTVIFMRHVPHGIVGMEENVAVAMCLARHMVHEIPSQEEFTVARCGLHLMRRL